MVGRNIGMLRTVMAIHGLECVMEVVKIIEVVWLKTGDATGQFHGTKLTVQHFEKMHTLG